MKAVNLKLILHNTIEGYINRIGIQRLLILITFQLHIVDTYKVVLILIKALVNSITTYVILT